MRELPLQRESQKYREINREINYRVIDKDMITKNLRHRFIDRVTNGQFVDRQKYRQEVIDKQLQTREPQQKKKQFQTKEMPHTVCKFQTE